MTPKEYVRTVVPDARLDFYESLRVPGGECWFIRVGMQGEKISLRSTTPRGAWRSARKTIRERAKKGGAQ